MAEEENSDWTCCSCGSSNSDVDVCFICEHPRCDTCKTLTENEVQEIVEGQEKAGAWLIGQKRNKETFSEEAYGKNQKEIQMQELQEQIESQMEEAGERKDVQRKKR